MNKPPENPIIANKIFPITFLSKESLSANNEDIISTNKIKSVAVVNRPKPFVFVQKKPTTLIKPKQIIAQNINKSFSKLFHP